MEQNGMANEILHLYENIWYAFLTPYDHGFSENNDVYLCLWEGVFGIKSKQIAFVKN